MSTMFPALRALGLCGGLGLLTGIAALEKDGTPFTNLTIGYASVPTPTITEKTTYNGGTSTYEWEGVAESGQQVSVTLLRGHMHPGAGGFIWGAEAVLANYDITPNSFKVGGVTFENGSSSKLEYLATGINLIAGYQYGISTNERFHGYVEVLPLIGLGLNRFENEVHTGGGTYSTYTDYGSYFQYGLRIGGFLTEKQWLLGLTASYLAGIGTEDVAFGTGRDDAGNQLTLEQSGFGFGIAAGYRF